MKFISIVLFTLFSLSGISQSAENTWLKRYYTGHVMSAFVQHVQNLDGWLIKLKGAGYNVLWIHHDNYDGYYKTNLQKLFDAADRVGGIEIMPGGGNTAKSYANCIKDSWEEKSLFRIKGKPVFSGWNWQEKLVKQIDSILLISGIKNSDYIQMSHAYSPYNTSLDGYLGFPVDLGTSDNNVALRKLIQQDTTMIVNSNNKKKYAFVGINESYSSPQTTYYGFRGLDSMWKAILKFPIGKRPIGVTETTTNDFVELSYMAPIPDSVIFGLSYIPARGKEYLLGNKMRYPITDHSGANEFCKPFIYAFLNDLVEPEIKKERMFASYPLHPHLSPPVWYLPEELKGVNKAVTQEWWDGTIYSAEAWSEVPGWSQVVNIVKLWPETVEIGVHLMKPAYLVINNDTSTLQQAGFRWFIIPLPQRTNLPNTPVFKILNEDKTVRMTRTGQQAITNSRWPGGWNRLIQELK